MSQIKSKSKNSSIQASKVFSKMTKLDYIWIVVITLIYAIIAFRDLGSTNAMESYVKMKQGDEIEVLFNKKVQLDSIYYYSGWVEQVDFDVKFNFNKDDSGIKDKKEKKDNELKNNEDKINKYRIENAFTWSLWSVEEKTDSVLIEALDKESSIYELVFFDENKKIIKPKSVRINGKKINALSDEAKYCPTKFTFRENPYFDEHIYVTAAYDLIHGRPTNEWTHPPLGKWFIALGMMIFGICPFGMRATGTLFGVIMLPCIYVFAKKIFDKTSYATLTCGLFALDFMHFVQSRIAVIDVYVVTFIILMYYFMYQYYKTSFYDTKLGKTWIMLLGAGISMGLGIACKWTGCYAAVGLAVIFFIIVYKRRKEYKYALQDREGETNGIKHSYIIEVYKPYLRKTILFCCVVFILIPLIIYTISYAPFRLQDNPDAGIIERIVENQKDMFNFHSTLKLENGHSSKWYSWPVIWKPIYYSSTILSSTQRQGINAMGNPLIWWVGIPAFIYVVINIFKKKEKKALFIAISYLSQYLPWIFISRMTFIYHYFASTPFVVIMIVYMFKDWLEEEENKRKKAYLIGYVVLTVILFIMFYPVLSGQTVSAEYVKNWLSWLSQWNLVV